MQSIVITGSARGVGFEMAAEFLRLGMNVTITSVNPESLSRAAEKLSGYHGRLLAVPCDVRNKEEVRNLWNASLEKWGHIDIWVNNAGISQPSNLMLWQLADSTTDGIVETNILGMIYGSQIAAAGMLKQGGGFIYNMEGLGSDGRIIRGTSLYGMTKWNLTYFTKALARELKGTPVCAGRLMPGMMPTGFITKPSIGETERVVDEQARRIFNILGDKPDVVARYLVKRMAENRSNNAHIVWLSTGKIIRRFAAAPFRKRDLFNI
jgi:NAD(P)-dependent dehydrogenase (short-subunit alcohol dehydrogenase family)